MPKELPGFYWDSQKNRYFPVSSKPQASGPSSNFNLGQENASKKRKLGHEHKSSQKHHLQDEESSSDSESTGNVFRSERRHPWRLSQAAYSQISSNWLSRERMTKEILSCHLGATTHLTYSHAAALGKVTAFATSLSEEPLPVEGHARYHLLGDDRGWLFRCKAYSDLDSRFEEPFQQSPGDSHEDYNRLPWSPELNLQPNGFVSSISVWGSRWVATGAGTSARFASSDITSLDRMFIVTLPGARDLWTSHLREKSIVLGASFRAIYIPDIDHSTSPEQLNTHSDVFAVHQDQHLIYTGSRNGSVYRFDRRLGFKGRGDLLFDSRFPNNQRSSVIHLNLLSGAGEHPSQFKSSSTTMEHGILLSQMDGKLQTFDLRFASTGKNGSRASQPLVCYNGHVNKYTRDLGLAVDYSNGFIYAAGQDCRIRGWSLDSGNPIIPSLPPELATALPNGLMPVFTASGLLPPNSMNLNSPVTASSQPDTSNSISPWKCYNPFLSQFPGHIPVLRVTSDGEDHTSFSGIQSTGQGVQGPTSYRHNQELVSSTRETSATLWAASRTDLWSWNLGQRHVVGTG